MAKSACNETHNAQRAADALLGIRGRRTEGIRRASCMLMGGSQKARCPCPPTAAAVQQQPPPRENRSVDLNLKRSGNNRRSVDSQLRQSLKDAKRANPSDKNLGDKSRRSPQCSHAPAGSLPSRPRGGDITLHPDLLKLHPKLGTTVQPNGLHPDLTVTSSPVQKESDTACSKHTSSMLRKPSGNDATDTSPRTQEVPLARDPPPASETDESGSDWLSFAWLSSPANTPKTRPRRVLDGGTVNSTSLSA